jgi:hypothetical protein
MDRLADRVCAGEGGGAADGAGEPPAFQSAMSLGAWRSVAPVTSTSRRLPSMGREITLERNRGGL